jgi:hypothetical protein
LDVGVAWLDVGDCCLSADVVLQYHVQLISYKITSRISTHNVLCILENPQERQSRRQLKSVLMLESVKRPNSRRGVHRHRQDQVRLRRMLANTRYSLKVSLERMYEPPLCFYSTFGHIFPDIDVSFIR